MAKNKEISFVGFIYLSQIRLKLVTVIDKIKLKS